MRFEDSEFVEVEDVVVLRELEKSIIVDYCGEEVVIPKSQIDEDSEVQGEGDEGTLIIPRWLAREREMIL